MIASAAEARRSIILAGTFCDEEMCYPCGLTGLKDWVIYLDAPIRCGCWCHRENRSWARGFEELSCEECFKAFLIPLEEMDAGPCCPVHLTPLRDRAWWDENYLDAS